MTHAEPETPGPAVDAFVAAYVAGATVTAAATRAGISRSTATRLLRDPRAIEQIRQLRADVRRRVVDKLAAAQDIAVATLIHHASADHIAPTASSSVTAARTLLSEGRAWTELQDLRDRIGDLEAALATGPPADDREARLAALRLHARVSGDGFDLSRECLAVKLAAMAANLRAPLDIGKPQAAVDETAAESA